MDNEDLSRSTRVPISTVSSFHSTLQDPEEGAVAAALESTFDATETNHGVEEPPTAMTPMRSRQDPPAISPIQLEQCKDPPAISPYKASPSDNAAKRADDDETLVMDYSVTPSKGLAAESDATNASSAVRRALADKEEAAAQPSHADTAATPAMQPSSPRRVPVVTLFPRASGEGEVVFDLPTTPNRADNSMDISSLQASPIVPTEESFVTLEESWRCAPPHTFQKDNALEQQDNGDLAAATSSAFGRFSPVQATASGAPAEIVHFTENVFAGWEFNGATNSTTHPSHKEPVPTFVDEFLASETPRTNNQSFTSEDSSSYKESFQSSRRGPPTIPNRFSRTSKPAGSRKVQHSGAPDLTASSNDTSGQSHDSPEQPSPYDNRSDVTRIIAALERVIPYESAPTQGKNEVMTNSSILYDGTDTDTSGAAEHTRSSLDTDYGDTRYSTESSSFPTDTFSSGATNDRSTAVYDEEEDIFDGLEMEPDHLEEERRPASDENDLDEPRLQLCARLCSRPVANI